MVIDRTSLHFLHVFKKSRNFYFGRDFKVDAWGPKIVVEHSVQKSSKMSHFSQHYELSELFNENIFQMKGEVLNETFLMIFTHCSSKLLANYDRLTFSNKIWGPYFRIRYLRV